MDKKELLNENIKSIKEEINDLEKEYDKAKTGGSQILWVVLGFIGLFFFLIPGLIFFIIAAVEYRNNSKRMVDTSSKIKELKRKLAEYKYELSNIKK